METSSEVVRTATAGEAPDDEDPAEENPYYKWRHPRLQVFVWDEEDVRGREGWVAARVWG